MFNFFGKKKPAPAPVTMRDTLFGNLPLDQWPPSKSAGSDAEPWTSFLRAQEAIGRNKRDEAVRLWQGIAQMPNRATLCKHGITYVSMVRSPLCSKRKRFTGSSLKYR
jgi:hypothetical protein